MKNTKFIVIATELCILLVFIAGVILVSKQKQSPKDVILDIEAPLAENQDYYLPYNIYYDATNGLLVALTPSQAREVDASKIVQTVPTRTEISSQKTSDDGKYIFYAVVSSLDFSLKGKSTGYSPDFGFAFVYEKATGDVDAVFAGNSISLEEPNTKSRRLYPHVTAIAPDSGLVAYTITPCYHCDGGQLTTIVFDTGAYDFKDLGRIMNFEFTGARSYEYDELVRYECEESDLGCSKAGDHHSDTFESE